MNSIVPFKKVGAPAPAPEVHPAAMAAAQLLLVNDVPDEDFQAAIQWFLDNAPNKDD